MKNNKGRNYTHILHIHMLYNVIVACQLLELTRRVMMSMVAVVCLNKKTDSTEL